MRLKTIEKWLDDMEDSIRNCGLASLAFTRAGITTQQKKILEKELQYGFDLWSKTWILYPIKEIKKELRRKTND